MKAGKIFILVVILMAISWLCYYFLSPKGKTKLILLPKMETVEESYGFTTIDKYYIVENPPEEQLVFRRLIDSVAKNESIENNSSIIIHFAYESEMSYRESTSSGDFYLNDLLGFCVIKKENNLVDVGPPVVYVGFDRFYKPKKMNY